MSTAIFIQILMSWVVSNTHRGYILLDSITKPVMTLAKKVTPKTGMFDFSPIVAFIGLEVLRNVWIFLVAQF